MLLRRSFERRGEKLEGSDSCCEERLTARSCSRMMLGGSFVSSPLSLSSADEEGEGVDLQLKKILVVVAEESRR